MPPNRRHISALLDKVEDENGPWQADAVLSIVRSMCTWYAKRDDDYDSPIVKGMERGGKKTKRARILSDDELAALWREEGAFGNFTKLALLTAQRKAKLFFMRWSDVRDGVWHIRAEAREKGNGEALRLPQVALEVLEDQRRLNGDSPFVFALTGSPNAKFHRLKGRFDAKHKDWPQWQVHDLRRTARSLMAAAGVPALHGELVLGHTQRGITAVYDRHSYIGEKGEALNKLAARIRDIVTPPPSNVERLRQAY